MVIVKVGGLLGIFSLEGLGFIDVFKEKGYPPTRPFFHSLNSPGKNDQKH